VVKQRALRADAERNRRHVLEVAQAVFAAEGLGIPIDEIARRAGLGVGTLYRHFPTKEALFVAIVLERMEAVTADARGLRQAEDPGAAFFGFLTRMVDGWGQKKDLVCALTSAGVDLEELAKAKRDLNHELGQLLERAQAAGAVRADVALGEIMALIGGTFSSIDRHGISTAGRDRLLSVIIDGLRPSR
jgi:AcrR family transcriptional regulator